MGFPHIEHPPTFGQTCFPVALSSSGDLGLASLEVVQADCLGGTATRPDGSVAAPPSQSFGNSKNLIAFVSAIIVYLVIGLC